LTARPGHRIIHAIRILSDREERGMPGRYELAERVRRMPPYLFAEIDRRKKAARAAGRDVIDLGVGDPDMPTPDFIVEALAEAARDPATHQYALDNGDPAFRAAIARHMQHRFGVDLDPESEIYPTIGSKEAIAHFPLAYVNPGDVTLVPEPGYPPYQRGTLFAGGEAFALPLVEENGFLPDLSSIPGDVLKRAKILYLNYPNSPTGVVAPREFLEKAVAFCREHGIILAHDAAYAEMVFEGRALSVLELDGACDVAIEFHSLSKTFNMTGWRVGWAAGSQELIAGLAKIKTNVDSGVFSAIQRAGAEALAGFEDVHGPMLDVYRARRDAFCEGLQALGFHMRVPDATFYVWFRTPDGWTSERTVARILDEADVVLTPGSGFGPSGEGYVRAALCRDESRIREAVERIGRLSW
jgi:LL-diaminopimelate aminotransferase